MTVSTGAAGAVHTLQPGDTITISGAANAGYNGNFTVLTVPGTRTFTYSNPNTGLPVSGGGTITLNVPGLRESGNTVTVSTVAAHGRTVGDVVTIAGAGVGGYNGSWTITGVPTPRQFTFTNPTAGLANSGAGTMTFISPFNVQVGTVNSVLINSANYTNAGLTAAMNATLVGNPVLPAGGSVAVTGTATTGFTVTYGGTLANTNVANFSIQNLSCGGCFAQVDETTHGGAFDSFTLNYNGATSAPIVNGTNYTQAGILAALAPILPAGTTPTLTAFGGGNISGLNNQGFGVSFGGTQAGLNVPFNLAVTNATTGSSGFVNELDTGGPVTNKGARSRRPATRSRSSRLRPGTRSRCGRRSRSRAPRPTPTTPRCSTAGSRTTVAAPPARRCSATSKTNGPLFAMFPKSGQISLDDALHVQLAGPEPPDGRSEPHVPGSPADHRQQHERRHRHVSADRADRTAGAAGVTECFAEFLPTSDYVGFAGTNASPPRLDFRFTARDNKGGTNAANPDTTLTLAAGTGPFLVTGSPGFVGGRLDADGHLERRRHERGADLARRT